MKYIFIEQSRVSYHVFIFKNIENWHMKCVVESRKN